MHLIINSLFITNYYLLGIDEMDSYQKIGKNIFSLFTGSFISMILSVIFSIYLARFLGDVLFGRYSFVIAFVYLFSIFLDLGYDTLIIRDVAKDKKKASTYLNNIITFRLVLSIIIFCIIFLLINFLGFQEELKNLIYIFGISQIILSLSSVYRVLFRAFERMDYEAVLNIFLNIIRSFLGILLLFFGYGLIWIAFVYIFTSVVDFFISLLICQKKFVKIKLQFDFSFFRDTIKTALPIGFLAIFALIYVRIDTVMLEFMKGDAVVGWYNAAYTLILGLIPIPHLFMNALLPYMSITSANARSSLTSAYEKSFKFLLGIGLPISIGIFLLADKFIILFFGPNFLNSVDALRILCWDVLLKFLYICIWVVLISIDKQKQLMICAGFGAFINILLNFILIPNFSLIGAAIATIITESFVLFVFFYLSVKYNLKITIIKSILKTLIACALMSIFIFSFNYLNIFLLITLSCIIYFFVFYIIKGLSREEITLIKKLIKKNK